MCGTSFSDYFGGIHVTNTIPMFRGVVCVVIIGGIVDHHCLEVVVCVVIIFVLLLLVELLTITV